MKQGENKGNEEIKKRSVDMRLVGISGKETKCSRMVENTGNYENE